MIALDSTIDQTPWWMCGTLRTAVARADAFVLHGLPMQLFDLEQNVLAAFRTLQSGTNTGKVVVRIPKTAPTPPRGAHLLSGGTGGLGLVTGKWLGEGGASSVVLAARGGKVAPADGEKLRKIAECSFSVVKCDAAELTDTARMVGAILAKGSTLAGVWHAAGVLSDGLLRGQTASTIKRVFAPKAFGAWALQQAWPPRRSTRACSSRRSPSLLGGGGQSNYAAANGCLDSLGACRRVRGQRRRPCSGARGRTSAWRRTRRSTRASRPAGWASSAWRRGRRPSRRRCCRTCPSVMSLVVLTWGKFLGMMPEVPPLLQGLCKPQGRRAAGDGPPARRSSSRST